jgi:hypothetical protein
VGSQRRAALTIVTVAALLAATACAPKHTVKYQGSREPNTGPAATVSPLAPAAGFVSIDADGRDLLTIHRWDGTTLGSFSLASLDPGNPGGTTYGPDLTLDPDARHIVINLDDNPVNPQYKVADLTGHVTASGRTGGSWSTDGTHLCALAPAPPPPDEFLPSTGPLVLVVTPPGGTSVVYDRHVANVTFDNPVLLRCDTAAGTAIVGQADSQSGGAQIIDLRTGAITTASWAAAHGTHAVAVSGNGAYAALATESSTTGQVSQGRVVDTRTGKVVSHLPGTPLAISWGGALVLESTTKKGGDSFLDVFDRVTGVTVWTSDTPAGPGVAVSSGPRASGFAVAARAHSDDLAVNVGRLLVLVTTRGAPRTIATNVVPGIA